MALRFLPAYLSNYIIRKHEAAPFRRHEPGGPFFPVEARRAAGHELWQVQNGLMPADFKAMPAVGPGAYEIRVHVLGEWRVVYVARLERAVYVLHAFQKKTQAARRGEIDLARRRYRQIEE